jgi:hypothetical protein
LGVVLFSWMRHKSPVAPAPSLVCVNQKSKKSSTLFVYALCLIACGCGLLDATPGNSGKDCCFLDAA